MIQHLPRLTFRWLLSAFLAGLWVLGWSAPPARGERAKVRVALGPSITTDMIGRHLLRTGVLKRWGEKADAEIELKTSGNPNILLAQNKADVVLLSTIDVTRLVQNDKLEIVIWGKESTSYESFYSKTGQPEVLPLNFKGKRLVHPGWNTRGTRIGQVLLKSLWGLDAEADFQVVTAPWRIGPDKLLEGEADLAINAMPFVLKGLQKGVLREVGKSFAGHWADLRGNGRRLGGLFWVSWQSWLQRERKRALALLGAWAEGMQYSHSDTKTWVRENLPLVMRGADKESIRFFLDWVRREQPIYASPYLSEEDIEDENQFLRLAVQSKLIHKMPDRPIWEMVRPR